jgi:hypothetical protein
MAFNVVNTPGVSPVIFKAAARIVVADLNITSYTNPGGEQLDPKAFNMTRILAVLPMSTSGRPATYVPGTGVAGKLVINQDATPAAAAALPEVPNATNVGVVRVVVFGQ